MVYHDPHDIRNTLAKYNYYNIYDLEDAFFHVPIHADDVHKTAFVTHLGSYEYTRLPFGLASSPVIFLKYLGEIIKAFGKKVLGFTLHG